MSEERIVVVGAGHAGTAAAAALRDKGYAGKLVLLSDEPVEPYERPPLSKAWLLSDDAARDSLLGREALAGRDIELRLNAAAQSIDGERRLVTLADGTSLAYTYLVLATGSRARVLPLPGFDAHGVHSLRSADDADALRQELTAGARLVVIGAGYIGLEVAASARARGAAVTIVELAERCMARTASETMSAYYHARHEAEGVRFIMPDGVEAIEAELGRARGVRLASGTLLPADLVLVAAGGVPDTELAEAAGLACDAGILTDGAGRTDDPSIYALGDAARRPTPWAAGPIRLESVHNALEMARLAAANITGTKPPPLAAPWFWSDQYDLKLQIAGLVAPGYEQVVRRSSGGLSVFHLAGEDLIAVEAVNDPRAYMVGRTALTKGLPVDPHILADPAANLKEALRR